MGLGVPLHSGRPGSGATLQGTHAQQPTAAVAAAAATRSGPEAAAAAAVVGAVSGPLFLRTGMLDVGGVFERALHSARTHGLEVSTCIRRLHPALPHTHYRVCITGTHIPAGVSTRLVPTHTQRLGRTMQCPACRNKCGYILYGKRYHAACVCDRAMWASLNG